MLFSYMLHFFVVIGAISVLAIPLPEEGKQFDFNAETDGRQSLSSEGGKILARGNWLRKAHPKNMFGDDVEPPGISIGDFLSLGNFRSQFRMFYCDADDEATTLVKKVLGYSVHKPYVENLPESERPSVITGENADKMVGIWQSVERPAMYIAIFRYVTTTNKKPYLFIRKYASQDIGEVEEIEKAHRPTA